MFRRCFGCVLMVFCRCSEGDLGCFGGVWGCFGRVLKCFVGVLWVFWRFRGRYFQKKNRKDCFGKKGECFWGCRCKKTVG